MAGRMAVRSLQEETSKRNQKFWRRKDERKSNIFKKKHFKWQTIQRARSFQFLNIFFHFEIYNGILEYLINFIAK